ncbi:MAG: purine-binding chemotaxis protein CheW [Myxococcales bacterium]|nr:purine-binding chemotaxis protein CheW [Myxococcales bacterium]
MLARTAPRPDHRAKNFIGFVIAGVDYAIDIQRVREIMAPLPLVSVPQAPREVLGVADHRGQVLPVVDMRRFFDLPPSEGLRTRWIVASVPSGGLVLAVDAMTSVFGVAHTEPAGSLPHSPPAGHERSIAAVCRHEGRLVFVIDVNRLAEATAGAIQYAVSGGVP